MTEQEIIRRLQAFTEELDKHFGWTKTAVQLPPEGVEVNTKVDDALGVRNVQTLVRRGRLWFFPDDSMYVYYEPTHWKLLKEPSE